MSVTPPCGPTIDPGEVLASLAELLDSPISALDPDTPLTELGLESFTAVRLRRRLREEVGLDLPMTAFLGSATARTVARGMATPEEQAATPEDTATPEERVSTPEEKASIEADFPLTPIQSAYWVGRDPAFPLGGVATFFYREYDRRPDTVDSVSDVRRLTTTWNQLVRRHPMLRMVVGTDARQRILSSVPHFEIPVTDLRGEHAETVENTVKSLRARWSHQVRPSDQWPLFDIQAVLLPGGITRLCIGIDVLALDFAGWMRLMEEWGGLMANPSAELGSARGTFAEVLRQRENDPSERHRRHNDRAYWAERVPTLPPGPKLPTNRHMSELRNHRFTRSSAELAPFEWESLRARAADHGLSPTGLLLAAFGLTLTRWGATEQFCLNATLFDRPDDSTSDAIVGDFTSTVLVEMPEWDALSWAGFADYANKANRQFWNDLDHRSVSGIEARRAAGQNSTTPTYPVVFTSGVGLSHSGDPASWLGEEVFGISQTPQVLLDYIVYDEGGALKVCWDSVEGAFPEGFIDRMLAAHMRLLRRLIHESEAWTDRGFGWDPSFMPEQRLDLTPFTTAGPLIDDPIRVALEYGPANAALLDTEKAISHNELARCRDGIADALAAAGVDPNELVAVSVEKSSAQVSAVLGVVATGAGYVPVEPSWPANRVASVCAQAGIRHALVGPDVELEWPESVLVHRLDADGMLTTADPEPMERRRAQRPQPDDLAYVIFTSGSTGHPKGVAIEHQSARNTIDDLIDRFPLSLGDRVLALSAFSFDLSVYDIFGVLGSGGALVLPSTARQRDPGHWLELMREHQVSVWNTAPALLEMLVEYAEIDPDMARAALTSLRLVFLSGDWIPVTLPERVRALAPRAQIVSLGGATEASIWSICHPIEQVDPEWTSIPYGRPLRGQFFHILDEQGRPLPIGEPGELHIGGRGLAREYVSDAERTRSRFVTHPTLSARLYRTGDLGRWRTDGAIEFLGRRDRQVKIRGHRVELGEIESVLDRVSGVRHSAALSVPGPDTRPRLVAYIVKREQSTRDTDITARLSEHLPSFMLPNRIVSLSEFPVTANGKIDYDALPNPYRSPDHDRLPHDRLPGHRLPSSSGFSDAAQLSGSNGSSDTRELTVDTTKSEFTFLDKASSPTEPATVSSEHDAASSQAAEKQGGLEEAIQDASHRGLHVALTLSPGLLPPSEALVAAGEWSRRLVETANHQGLRATPQLTDGGLIQLTFSPGSGKGSSWRTSPEADSRESSVDSPRSVLPETESTSPQASPQTNQATERFIQHVFSGLLESDVDPTAPLFELGATSLTLVLAHRRLTTDLGTDLSVVDLLEHPTVRDLAALVTERSANPEIADSPTAARDRAPSRRDARARAAEVAQ